VTGICSACVVLDPMSDSNTPKNGLSTSGPYGESAYLRLTTLYLVRLPDGTEMISKTFANADDSLAGAPVRLHWKPTDIRLHVE
jgi:hypothetical protein